MGGSPAARRSGIVVALLGLLGLVSAACGGRTSPARAAADTSELHGVQLVVGSELGSWSLLAVPRSGGRATARDVRDPSHVVWTGATELPRTKGVHVLEGPTLVLRTGKDEVYRYDPLSDSLARVGKVARDARWSAWGSYGAFLAPGDGRVLELGPEDAWRYELAGKPSWVVPVEDGDLAVLGVDAGRKGSVWLVSRGDSAPASRSDAGYAAPGLATAWGKRVVLTAADRRSVRVLTVPALTSAEEVSVRGPVAALAASPSSNELYAALSDPAMIVGVNRFDRRSRVVARLDGPVSALRPAVLGAFLLAHRGASVVWVPLSGGVTRSVEADWREDLPMGTPAGEVLLSRGDSLFLWTPGDDTPPAPVHGPGDAWWMAVRWNPAPPPVQVARAGGDSAVEAPTEQGASPGGVAGGASAARTGVGGRKSAPTTGEPPSPVGATTPSPAASRGSVAAETIPGSPSPGAASGGGQARPEAGVYAIVASARDPAGVRSLLKDLASAGYPTAMQRYTDDAGRTWYRGMVGPYPSRDAAESAARQLRRERQLRVWVTEIRPGSGFQGIR